MKNVTPEAMRCVAMFSCPAIIEVTPEDMRCSIFASCPAIYEQQDGYIIIGKKIPDLPPELLGRVGDDEYAIWVPKGLVKPGDAA